KTLTRLPQEFVHAVLSQSWRLERIGEILIEIVQQAPNHPFCTSLLCHPGLGRCARNGIGIRWQSSFKAPLHICQSFGLQTVIQIGLDPVLQTLTDRASML